VKILLKIEYAALLVLSVFLFSFLPFAWWWYLALFLVPDIGMVGYLFSSRVGAWTYNALHTLAVGISMYLVGYFFSNGFVELAGIIIIGHIGLDRLLGYGLKHADSFKHTHLGML
jgi:hypothetical protein